MYRSLYGHLAAYQEQKLTSRDTTVRTKYSSTVSIVVTYVRLEKLQGTKLFVPLNTHFSSIFVNEPKNKKCESFLVSGFETRHPEHLKL